MSITSAIAPRAQTKKTPDEQAFFTTMQGFIHAFASLNDLNFQSCREFGQAFVDDGRIAGAVLTRCLCGSDSLLIPCARR
jgi:hypothetical protein